MASTISLLLQCKIKIKIKNDFTEILKKRKWKNDPHRHKYDEVVAVEVPFSGRERPTRILGLEKTA